MMDSNKQLDVPIKISVLIIIVFVVWFLSAIGSILFLPKWEERAQLGDMFGSVNSLFSGLAFAVLIYTMWLQRTELTLQRQELELTRQELARTAAAQEATQKAVEVQAELMILAADLSATATLLEANQKVGNKIAEHYGYHLERLQIELQKRTKELRILKSDSKENS